jgi:hypothetical protein
MNWRKLDEMVLKAKRLDLLAAESGVPDEAQKRLIRCSYTTFGVSAQFFLINSDSYASNGATR